MINQKINRELFSGQTTTLAASRSVFQTVVVLNMQRFQFRSQSFMSFPIQDTLMEKGILLSENTKNWEQECYDLAFVECQCGYRNSRKKNFWYSEHIHFDIIIDGSPAKFMVFTIQCNDYGQTNWKNRRATLNFLFF